MILPILSIAPSPERGRGVFTTQDIETGTIVEISPVLVLDPEERAKVEQTLLFDYIFEWGDDLKSACVALGYLSVYNHSYTANCIYEMDFENELMQIRTVKPIKTGEELFINYNADPDNAKPIWFEAS
ncbi:SET domain-containing protein [Sediminibacterium sp.]|uniref:SET domain-containing protein n=1 Tax=Sediminibacterium sp. TaxID=1917865 RepID=UPI0025E4D6AD|nr:SET domain-containing protein [Sediminibacterium sp.]MBW0177882.1 SET domain-containing protein [Sediminibacterium sp.]